MLSGSDHLVNARVRVIAIELLLQHPPKDLLALVKTLKSNEDRVSTPGTRYFDNSNVHIVKQRICQAFLLMTQLDSISTDRNTIEYLLEIALVNIEAPSQQLSVRYMYEWILVILAKLKKNVILPRIRECLEKAKTTRLGIVPAYLCILTHQADLDNDSDIEEILEFIAPWCLGQQFMTRLCANSCFKKLFSSLSCPKIQNKYLILSKCINETVDQGDKSKNEEKILSDFYLNSFDPVNNLNLSDIFYHFPRLLNVNDVIKDNIWSSDYEELTLKVPKFQEKSLLNKHREMFCICETCLSADKQDGLEINLDEAQEGQVQKKITPWSQMFDLEQESKKNPCHTDLIMVASLIDRAPNLGGLSRTCEIFGAGKLILNNKKIINDKEFVGTSVTAHQWIDIEEIKIENLKNYLETMKSQNYTIVGIEQTSESCKLNEFKFPKKSVILLGNEKEGIPVELIQLLDVCVEIPQTGLIRSLNVHVTGAIIVWEYVRQQIA